MHFFFTLFLCLLALQSRADPVIIVTPIVESEKRKLDAFVDGRPLLSINGYSSPYFDSIGPLENFLFRKAVLLGGLDAQFEDFIVPNSARARASLRSGAALAGGAAHWHLYYPAVQEQVLESDAVIQRGWYEKGLYTTKIKLPNYSIKTLRDLGKLGAVSSQTWEADWATLGRMNLAYLYSGSTRASQFKMVEGNRADFTLQDFSSLPDLSIEEQGITLYPIPGIKIALAGSRHFWVYKHHPSSQAIFDSLQKGLKIMEQQGEIEKALIESGIRNKAVQDWILLNPE